MHVLPRTHNGHADREKRPTEGHTIEEGPGPRRTKEHPRDPRGCRPEYSPGDLGLVMVCVPCGLAREDSGASTSFSPCRPSSLVLVSKLVSVSLHGRSMPLPGCGGHGRIPSDNDLGLSFLPGHHRLLTAVPPSRRRSRVTLSSYVDHAVTRCRERQWHLVVTDGLVGGDWIEREK